MKKGIIILAIVSFFALGTTVIDSNQFDRPEHFPKPIYDFQNNPLTASGVDLGRALFYDPILSIDNTISCASCHSPYNAFAHTDHDLSHGINDKIGRRNAPALFNLAWQESFMWDGAVNHLDMQALAPISHPDEMGENISNVVEKLQNQKIYPPLFYAAFGDSTVTGEHTLQALSQFQLTLISANSKYDKVIKGKLQYEEKEKKGYKIFQENCNSCHTEPLFSSYGFARNGLQIDTTLNDMGRMEISNHKADSLLFKIPSLRNLSYTYPYMHDGRFRRLKDVVNHYNSIPEKANNASEELRNIKQLTPNEQKELIAFLLTLNDTSFVFDKTNKFPVEILKY